MVEKYKFEILVGLLYPKIDSAVSSHTNHLLKAPFNIHSASLLLSVPVNPEDFDINKIPSIQQIVEDKVSLKEYLAQFKDFIQRLKDSNSRQTNAVNLNAKRNIQNQIQIEAKVSKKMHS